MQSALTPGLSTSDVPAIMDIDGEVEWGTTATISIVPGAVRIVAPESQVT